MMQCLHRARLHLYPDIPIMFFADPPFLEFLFPDKKKRDKMTVSISQLTTFTENPSLNPMLSNKELKERMGISSTNNKNMTKFRKLATWIWKYGYQIDPLTIMEYDKNVKL